MPEPRRVHAIVTTLWAVAVLVHLLGNPSSWYGEALPALTGLVPVVVAVLAAGLALRPHDRGAGVALVVGVWVLALVRLPILPNNLVLLGVIGVALHVPRDPVVALRLVVRAGAAAYVFAAFAKYNTAFLDPTLSCAPIILDRLVGSWGLPSVPRWTADVAPWLALLTESAVAIGLLVPRLRRHAAMLGVAFHGLLAYDLDQHFWDFTAALLPVFAAASPAVVDRLVTVAGRQVRPLLVRAGVVLVALVAALTGVALPPTAFLFVGHTVWLVLGSALVVGWLAVHLVRRPAAVSWPDAASWTPTSVVLVALVVANGLTPYLQVKTGYGWNMYANLRVVDDDTNHLLVPAVDLRNGYDDLLTVIEASDPAIEAYTDLDARLPRTQLVAWVARTPGAVVDVRTDDGTELRLRHGEVEPVDADWVTWLAPLRPVTDACLLVYGPAG